MRLFAGLLFLGWVFVPHAEGKDWTTEDFRLPDSIHPLSYTIDIKAYLNPDDQGPNYNGTDPQQGTKIIRQFGEGTPI